MSDPALNRMADVVRALVDIMQDRLPAVDFADERAVLKDGGFGAFGIGEASGPDRAREAAMRAVLDLKRNGGAFQQESE
ncbi:hypothetical protein [Novosphingobium naphthalenivorans]|uniref:hypothetical protein n=1 Tax=Novosphingobium naphthalenivorans TaxID=273168 RepID=UPI000A8F7A5A|nr:hypothetical protein [Novosphingobium naphthalenivorans]